MTPTQACARCPRSAQNCAGPCPCLEDGKDITLHQSRGYCSLGHFGTTKKPEGWDEMPAAPAPAPAAPATPGQWPLRVRLVASMRRPGDVGVGDTIARLINKLPGYRGMPLGDAFKAFTKKLGMDCGCRRRQDHANALYPYDWPPPAPASGTTPGGPDAVSTSSPPKNGA